MSVSREKNSEYFKKWYEDNKEIQYERVKNRKKFILEWFREYKKTLSCEKCGESFWACLDFHHRDPSTKEGGIISLIVRRGWGIDRLMTEIEKCDVLCANCHRKFHWLENEYE